MKVNLEHISPKYLVVKGIRKCWKSDDKSDSDIATDTLGENDKALVKRIIGHGHLSTFEHSQITFNIDDVSRALLQELSRHRIGVSPSVESTRYTLNRILKGEDKISNTIVMTGNADIDAMNIEHMIRLVHYIRENKVPNDIAKYGLVEAYKVSEQITFNFRSFREFLKLRLDARALWEIRALAEMMIAQIPDDYMIFFEDIL